MSVEKIRTENDYIIRQGDFFIYLTIKNKTDYYVNSCQKYVVQNDNFKFNNSKPEVIKAIGELLIEASQVREEESKEEESKEEEV